MVRKLKQCLIYGIYLLLANLAIISLFYLFLLLSRPPRAPLEKVLFPGVSYQRLFRSKPRPVLIHVVSLDLSKPGLKLFVTPGKPGNDGLEIGAQTTTDFLEKYQLNIAINGSFFSPFYVHNPVNFYPRSGDRVNVQGQSISNGISYSPPQQNWSVFCVSGMGVVSVEIVQCPVGTQQALAGSPILVNQGKIIQGAVNLDLEPRPRTAVGIDRPGKRVWLIVIDGRQPFYSEGLTLLELAQLALTLGVDRLLNLDGGGSTTLAISQGQKAKILNSPIHTRIPQRQRPVGNHLGVKVE